MPAQKRLPSSEDLPDDESSSLPPNPRRKQLRLEGHRAGDDEGEDDGEEQVEDDDEEEENDDDDDEESDGIPSDPEALSEFVNVDLAELRGDVQCAICLGIIKKTRTVMGCMHRFCRECIDKSMRLGNNECPTCRTHCASRRSLRDDSRYDSIITSLYNDIDKYEEEELSLHEEEKTRNKQIQASIAQIFQRQSEALNKRIRTGKDTAGASSQRLPRKYRNSYSRKRKDNRNTENQESDEIDEDNNHEENKDSSSSEDQGTEIKQTKSKGGKVVARRAHRPSSAADLEGALENETEPRKEIDGSSPGIAWKTERISWGGGGARSHNRHGGSSNNKGTRSARLAKLVDYLQSLPRDDKGLEVHLELFLLDELATPGLQKSCLCCHSHLTVRHLCDYIASETLMEAKEVEILHIKQTLNAKSEQSVMIPSPPIDEQSTFVALEGRITLAELQANCASTNGNLVLAYRQKGQ